ncbi:MAG TPA: Ig domain-containing protein, partial [Candidatus Hydrogenedentes bacterium]|nr:Ig domain-containing protein [Candidatus Hydrogenedentota bacterium]
ANMTARQPSFTGNVVRGTERDDAQPLLAGQNPYTGTITPFIGQFEGNVNANTRGWLKASFWNITTAQAASWTPVANGLEYTVLRSSTGDSVYEGYDQVFVRNTGSGTLNNIALSVNGQAARLLEGDSYPTAGELQAGRYWTTTVPADSVVKANFEPVISEIPDQTAQDGNSFSLTPTLDQGSDPSSVWSLVEPANLPSGMTFDTATGQIVWSPVYMLQGPLAFTLRVETLFGADEETFTLTVLPTPPSVAPLSNWTAVPGVPFSAQATLAGYATEPVTWSLATAPAGMTIDAATGVISWISAYTTGSPETVTVQAANIAGTAQTSFTVLVTPALSVSQPGSAVRYLGSANPVTFTAIVSGGLNPSQYVWRQRDVATDTVTDIASGAITGSEVSCTVDPSTLPAGVYEYTVTVTDEYTPGGDTYSVNSLPGQLQIAGHLTVTQDIADATVIRGTRFEWQVLVDGGLGTIRYQWRKDDGSKAFIPLTDGGGIVGTDTHTLVFTSFQESQAGTYDVVISDDFESVTAGPATLYYDQGIPAGGMALYSLLGAALALSGAVISSRRAKNS